MTTLPSSSSSSSMALLPSPAANDGITALSYFSVNRCCTEDSNGNPASTTTSTSTSSSSTTLLASTSWDGCIRIHDTTDPFHAKLVTQHNMEAGPLLALDTYCSSTTSNSTGSTTKSDEEDLFDAVFTGGLDGSIRRFHVPTSRMEVVGSHYHQQDRDKRESNSQEENVVLDCACSCIRVLNEKVVASAGWDSCFYLWNTSFSRIPTTAAAAAARTRDDDDDDDHLNSAAASASTLDASGGNDHHHHDNVTRQPLAKILLPGKAFSMDSISPSPNFHRIAIATGNRRLVIIDVELLDGDRVSCAKVVLDRESSLKYQSRVCRFFPDGSGIAIGSIEGRVAIEFLTELNVEPPQKNMKKYAFKCHRQNDIVYPVNDIAFHPTYGTFATGGCDGTVVTWDGLHKKKLTVLPTFPTSIAALAFSRDGKQLAIASSYTFERGGEGDCNEHPNKDDEIYIKILNDKDILPKTVSGSN